MTADLTDRKLLEQQQAVIDSLGVPDEPASQEVLERLQGLQFVGARRRREA